MDPFEAACAGVLVHARAGRLAAEWIGPEGVIARDVIEALPRARFGALSVALRALARVNLAAIERNAARLRRWPVRWREAVRGRQGRRAPVTARCATARAALAGGATRLAVATANEAAELRAAGVSEPLLVMGALSAEELPVALAGGGGADRLDRRVRDRRGGWPRLPPSRSTSSSTAGMGRLGTRDVNEALAVAELRASAPRRRSS